MTLRLRFPEREDALRGNVELVDDHDRRLAIGHLEIEADMVPATGPFQSRLTFVGHAEGDGVPS